MTRARPSFLLPPQLQALTGKETPRSTTGTLPSRLLASRAVADDLFTLANISITCIYIMQLKLHLHLLTLNVSSQLGNI
jgi:hypothetical protein